MALGIDIAPLLVEAKRQLHEEADYVREGDYLAQFGALLADDAAYTVPALHPALSGKNVLVMSYMESVAIESTVTAPQEERAAHAQEAADHRLDADVLR